METTNGGSRGYLVSIVMVAVLGGLLFSYDTAVISRAEKGLEAFFIPNRSLGFLCVVRQREIL